MKISIDYDGTMWSHMAFFRALMHTMQTAGHQVGVLTGHTPDGKDRDIALMVARGFPVPDFWFGRTEAYISSNGAVYKSDTILKENIDIHFDDYDFNNPETEAIFKEKLGDQFYRVIKVEHREPTSTHYE